jgi:hypothetical protein
MTAKVESRDRLHLPLPAPAEQTISGSSRDQLDPRQGVQFPSCIV